MLLLPLKDAGAGLNLSEAQHVLLMEPALSPAMEAQVCCALMLACIRDTAGCMA